MRQHLGSGDVRLFWVNWSKSEKCQIYDFLWLSNTTTFKNKTPTTHRQYKDMTHSDSKVRQSRQVQKRNKTPHHILKFKYITKQPTQTLHNTKPYH